ncbi:MAG: hypothetical protein RBG13Loki_0979 [Promethearchaeota archaeon CR_4]|nr:MAG: hypothetical protein RBG13Loki_0979 [Candidatus Lokiarchaeota archaeon CR_4]
MQETPKPTKAILTRLKSSLDLPKNIINDIQASFPNALVIFPGDYKKILLFPRQISRVLWVRLEMSSKALQQDFFLAISKLIESLELKAIYTTGICFQGAYCTWEGFFDDLPQITAKDLETEFRKVATVQKVEITILEVA